MKILQIDDSEQICEMFADMFIADHNSIESTNNGKIGLKLVIKNDYDLILLDIRMPKYSGIDFLRDLKKQKPSELKKIVVTSLLDFDQNQVNELMEFGIHSVEKKPTSFQQIENIHKSVFQNEEGKNPKSTSMLIIDDRHEETSILSKLFSDNGFQTKVANDPWKGFRKIQEEKFDVILLELDRQEHNGLKIIEMLAADEILEFQNIFILPARFGHNNKVKELSKKKGINTILDGPLDANSILEIIIKDTNSKKQVNLRTI